MLYSTIFRKDPTPEELHEFCVLFLETTVRESTKMVEAAPGTLFVFAAGNDGLNNDKYPTSPTNIQADNVTFNQVKYQLATLLETPIVISDKYLDSKLHDWQIHYKYFDLMASGFKDNYGVEIEKKIVNYPEYIITKKTP